MSLVQFNFESQYLGNNTTISIILPDKPRTVDAKEYYSKDKKYKVLWLLPWNIWRSFGLGEKEHD